MNRKTQYCKNGLSSLTSKYTFNAMRQSSNKFEKAILKCYIKWEESLSQFWRRKSIYPLKYQTIIIYLSWYCYRKYLETPVEENRELRNGQWELGSWQRCIIYQWEKYTQLINDAGTTGHLYGKWSNWMQTSHNVSL